jgi:hypothetical protein
VTPQSHTVVVLGGDDGRRRWRRIDEPSGAYLDRDGIMSVDGCGGEGAAEDLRGASPSGGSVAVAVVRCLLHEI